MGAIHISRQDLTDSLIEIVGFKSGVVLDEGELRSYLADNSHIATILAPDGPGGGRIRAEDYEDAVVSLLYRLGNTPSPDNVFFTVELYHKYKSDEAAMTLFEAVALIYNEEMPKAAEATPKGGLIDPRKFLDRVISLHGREGLRVAGEMIDGMNRDVHRSAWADVRHVQWQDEVELKELFQSENLTTSHGTFLDQRFIDYLARNFEDINAMNWRKFEGLTGEFFHREGYAVEMGPGRNDDGIDLRIFPRTLIEDGAPPLIIVQCKRVKQQIDKTLIKAVHADVVHENAQSGLIVTTSKLSPGAAELRTARGYKVHAADRVTLRQWIDRMRTSS